MASLKLLNTPSMVAISLIDLGILYFFAQGTEINAQPVLSFLSDWKLSGLAAIAATPVIVALSLALPRQVKDALVYWRWPYAAPGYRAFSAHAQKDYRVDFNRLKETISELQDQEILSPEIENKIWYRLYKQCEKTPSVSQAHKSWLLYRDLTTLTYLFFATLVSVCIILKPAVDWRPFLFFFALELCIFSIAARNAGVQFVRNVLAVSSNNGT